MNTARGGGCPTRWIKNSIYGTSCCRSCSDDVGEYSALFSSKGIIYQKVCRMVRGYQKGQPDAFLQGDGLFISHGDPRQPIWTYAAGYSDHKNTANHTISNCDLACENRACGLLTFDHFLNFWLL